MTGEASPHDTATSVVPPVNHLTDFVAELRRLRQDAGQPSLRKMSEIAHYSHTALASVLSATRLPSLDLTLAFVRACHADVDVWRQRWQTANAAIHPQQPAPTGLAGAPVEARTAPAVAGLPAGWWRPERGALVLTSSVVALIVTVAVALMVWSPRTDPEAASAGIAVAAGPSDGVDPKDANCQADAVNVVTVDVPKIVDVSRTDGAPPAFGHLTLRYSQRCGAAWPLFMPTPQMPGGVTVHLETSRPSDGEVVPFDYPYAVNSQAFDVYGNLLRTDKGCVTVSVDILDASGQISLATGASPCTALH